MMKLITTLVSIALLSASVDAKKPAFAPKRYTHDVLSIRGGAGPLDPDMIAKTVTGVMAIQGAADYLAPNKAPEVLYGIEGAGATEIFINEFAGANTLKWVIMAYGVLFGGLSEKRAIGYGLLPTVLFGIRGLLSGSTEAVGCDMTAQWIDSALTVFTSHAALTDADYSTTLVKAWCVYSGLASGLCRLAPELALDKWGFPEKGPLTVFFIKSMSQFALAATVLTGLLISGVDSHKAVGYSLVPLLASVLQFVLSGDLKAQIGDNVVKAYPWIAILAAAVFTLAI
ncbi:hypothetical protein THAOC_04258 [Thalassiosira oceanica]|uniref:Uncharacterized protein n=1 Tax=Thalassiosira oceanica TaxID=159749 RepID=K0T994_THAOC|nr:hypothetical protein THAOC_04258 [Thalassiosira oceanica]|eukprot:EJK74090.1 hypothetical protein THAOC_04258 [Thalassiosira oceanica]